MRLLILAYSVNTNRCFHHCFWNQVSQVLRFLNSKLQQANCIVHKHVTLHISFPAGPSIPIERGKGNRARVRASSTKAHTSFFHKRHLLHEHKTIQRNADYRQSIESLKAVGPDHRDEMHTLTFLKATTEFLTGGLKPLPIQHKSAQSFAAESLKRTG